MRLLADDTHFESVTQINKDLISLNKWSNQWRVLFNPSKTVYMHFTRKSEIPDHSPLIFNGTALNCVPSHKHLGIYINEKLKWDDHISYIIEKVSKRLSNMRRIQSIVPRFCLENIYKSMIRPIIDYGDVLYPVLPSTQAKRLESLQRQAALICTHAYQRTPHLFLLKELGWDDLLKRRMYHCLIIIYKIQNQLTPNYLTCLCPETRAQTVRYNLRRETYLNMFYCSYYSF